MNVKVLFFARAKELAGRANIEVAMGDEATVGDLKQLLIEQHPEMEELLQFSVVSVDRKVANDDHVIYHGAEVGILPPVSGG
ncbi:MAG: MoaD/ThiS family protein [Pirellulaceae bacterium]